MHHIIRIMYIGLFSENFKIEAGRFFSLYNFNRNFFLLSYSTFTLIYKPTR